MYMFYLQQYLVIKTKCHRSHILVMVCNLPLENRFAAQLLQEYNYFLLYEILGMSTFQHVPKLLKFFPHKSFE